jgi:elongator complex protein 6
MNSFRRREYKTPPAQGSIVDTQR